MENDNTSRTTNTWSNTWNMHAYVADNTDCGHKRSTKEKEQTAMVETRRARIKKLITSAHVKFVAGEPVGSELFWDCALNDIDPKTLYAEFEELELSQIIDSHTGERNERDTKD